MSRKIAMPAAIAAAGIAGVVTTVTITGGQAAPAAEPAVRVSTATVRLTNLSTTVLTAGTLGYAQARPLTNQMNGTYTWLPAAGAKIRPGQVLYRVDNDSVIAMSGRTPAWRTMVPGMSGPDVRQLQANLIRLGDAAGLLTEPTGYFDLLTADAVERWQHAAGLPVTGQVGLGQVIFLPVAVRVGQVSAVPGGAAHPGQEPYQVTTTRRVVFVPVNPALPDVRIGASVSIVLPSLARVPGRVVAIGVPQGATGSAGGSGQRTAISATAVLTVAPRRPAATGTASGVAVQVALTAASVRHVLAVPVAALLALSGGGYGVEIVTAAGRHRLVGVGTGTFAGGLVQVTGAGITAGVKVVVAQ